MPELPEVTTIINFLKNTILDKNINKFHYYLERNHFLLNNNLLKNEKINTIHRRGKLMIFETEKSFFTIHLRMEGRIFVVPNDEQMILNLGHKIIRIKFKEISLILMDTRKFATFNIYNKEENNMKLTDIPELKNIGMEPWDLKPSILHSRLNNSVSNIKTLLLNQKIIAGLGNIYVCEVLYFCKISPFRRGKDINFDEVLMILKYSKKILEKSIEEGGSTVSTWKFGNYDSNSNKDINIGNYQNYLMVYGKKELDNYKVKWEKINGRGTFWIPKIQK